MQKYPVDKDLKLKKMQKRLLSAVVMVGALSLPFMTIVVCSHLPMYLITYILNIMNADQGSYYLFPY